MGANTLVLGVQEREGGTVAGAQRAWEGDVHGAGTQSGAMGKNLILFKYYLNHDGNTLTFSTGQWHELTYL